MQAKSRSSTKQMSNHARVLRYIFRNQPVSRSEIGDNLAMPRPMITGVTANLLGSGVVRELGKAETTEDGSVGRRRQLIGIQPDSNYAIGVEIGTRHFRFCLTDLSGHTVDKICYVPSKDQIAQVNGCICQGVRTLLSRNPQQAQKFIGVGVALPGHLNIQSGSMVTLSTIWGAFNTHDLEKELQCPVTAENNVRAMAYERYLFNARSCPENFVFLHVGAGIFCADFKNGALTGGNYITGEIGHTISNPDGPRCECGKYGCLQTYASEDWILKKARVIHSSSSSSALKDLAETPEAITWQTVLDAYALGDTLVTRELREAVRYLSIAAANLSIIMGSEKLYLHSRLFQSEVLRNELKTGIEAQLNFVDRGTSEDVEILEFHPERAAVGAAALAIDRLFICE